MKISFLITLFGLALPAFSQAGSELYIPSDSQAKYTVINKRGSKKMPTLTTKRVGSSGVNYSKRLFDCKARTTKYLGTGDTMKEMKASMPDPKMSMIIDGSIADYQWKYACNR
ncbi:hypothetical protein [Laribacter hongkongensis]|uniref:hypothetical protein n=1 Tax=Laribacter hongkongensis TaxID=168471 RepID=UPI001EFE1800|nr:hypothetical protein [Laribacter hongkongensis]MCG9100224.1 hypothetical protein [Laribacter hongkongensis]MCG9115256.1 hypothetical protein [Laribacter hongkongensis]